MTSQDLCKMVRELAHYVGVYGTLETLKFYAKEPPKPESLSVPRACARVLAEDVTSGVNVPDHDTAKIDGFAVMAENVAMASESSPIRLKICKDGASSVTPKSALRGEAYPIAAGQHLPQGTDTVLPVKSVQAAIDVITVTSPVESGTFVSRAGTDVKRGQTILSKGTDLRTQEIGLLSRSGVTRIKVYKQPKIAILAAETKKPDGGADDSIGSRAVALTRMIARLIEGAGGVPLILGRPSNSSKAIAHALSVALKDAQMVLTITSPRGEQADRVDTAINSFGKPGVVVRGVRIHQGRFMGFGVAQEKPIIIVPDEVQGALNAFVVFVYPLIRNLLGHSFEEPPQIIATLDADWEADEMLRKYTKILYLSLWTGPHGLVAGKVVEDNENVSPLTKVNAYLVVPESLMSLKKGTTVWVHILPGFSYAGARFL